MNRRASTILEVYDSSAMCRSSELPPCSVDASILNGDQGGFSVAECTLCQSIGSMRFAIWYLLTSSLSEYTK